MRNSLPTLAPIGLAIFSLTSCGEVPPRGEALDEVSRTTANRLGVDGPWTSAQARSAIDGMLADGRLEVDEAVRIALANNPQFQGILEDLNITRAEIWQAVLPPNPVMGVQYLWLKHDPARVVDLSGTIDLIQLVLIPVKRQVAVAHYEEAKARVAGAAIQLAVETRAAYRGLQVQLALLDSLRIPFDSTAPTSPSAGTTESEDRRPIEMNLLDQDQRLQIASASAAVGAMRENLALLLGLDRGDTTFTLDASLELPPPLNLDASSVERSAIDASFELAAARSRIDALGHSMGLHRIETMFPRGEVGATANKDEHDGDNHDHDDEDDEWAVGSTARFSLPIFDWGQASDEANRARLDRELRSLTSLALHIRRAARANWILASTAESNLRFFQENIRPLSTRAYEGDLDPATRVRALLARLRAAAILREYWTARSNLEALMLGVVPMQRFSMPVGTPSGFEGVGAVDANAVLGGG